MWRFLLNRFEVTFKINDNFDRIILKNFSYRSNQKHIVHFLVDKFYAPCSHLLVNREIQFFPSTEYNFKGFIHVLITIWDNPCSVSRRERISSHFDNINSFIFMKILSVHSLYLWSYRHRTTYLYLIIKWPFFQVLLPSDRHMIKIFHIIGRNSFCIMDGNRFVKGWK